MMRLYDRPQWVEGPWIADVSLRANSVGVSSASGIPICELVHGSGFADGGPFTSKEWKINHARLMAASPEMYRALVEVCGWLESSLRCPDHPWDKDQELAARASLGDAHLVLDKVFGRE